MTVTRRDFLRVGSRAIALVGSAAFTGTAVAGDMVRLRAPLANPDPVVEFAQRKMAAWDLWLASKNPYGDVQFYDAWLDASLRMRRADPTTLQGVGAKLSSLLDRMNPDEKPAYRDDDGVIRQVLLTIEGMTGEPTIGRPAVPPVMNWEWVRSGSVYGLRGTGVEAERPWWPYVNDHPRLWGAGHA